MKIDIDMTLDLEINTLEKVNFWPISNTVLEMGQVLVLELISPVSVF